MLRFSQQIQSLKEQLEGLRAERDADAENHSVETEELLKRVTTAQQERNLLQEALEGQAQEREQQLAELDGGMEKLRMEVSCFLQVAPSSQTGKLIM